MSHPERELRFLEREFHWTVILLRPDYMSDWSATPHHKNTYVSQLAVLGVVNYDDLIAKAQSEVWRADRRDMRKSLLVGDTGNLYVKLRKEDYTLIALIEGDVKVKLHGWQA